MTPNEGLSAVIGGGLVAVITGLMKIFLRRENNVEMLFNEWREIAEQLKDDLDRLKTENAKLITNIEELKMQNNQLKKSLSELKAENGQLKDEVRALHAKVSSL